MFKLIIFFSSQTIILIQVEINAKRKHYSVRSAAKQTFLL